jgi:AAT family amino acid transporter
MLKSRHLQMIALGGAIGTGLFYGASQSISTTGPSIILAYILGGFMMYVVMRALGEMTVHAPNFGAFSHYAYQYVGDYLGFVAGWFAWFEYTVVCMLEITATATFLDYWLPNVPHWISISVMLGALLLINLSKINVFGEFEFLLTGVKVITILLMLCMGFYLVLFDDVIHTAAVMHVSDIFGSSIFPYGIQGFLFSLVLVIFSFGGVQFISIAASDTKDPAKSVPRAIRGIVVRILIFYIGTFVMIFCLYPWRHLNSKTSPFIDVFDKIGFHHTAAIISLVVITAALSAFNSCFYAAARMLANLANHGSAPNFLSKLNAHNVPQSSVYATFCIILFTVILNYFYPQQAIMCLIAITTTSILVTWSSILICHLGFRSKVTNNSHYKLYGSPFINYFTLLMLCGILSIMCFMPSMRIAVSMMPVWFAGVTVAYFCIKKHIK